METKQPTMKPSNGVNQHSKDVCLPLSTREGFQEVTGLKDVRLKLRLLHQGGLCVKASKQQQPALWGFSHSSHKNQSKKGPGYLRSGDMPTHSPIRRSVTLISPWSAAARKALDTAWELGRGKAVGEENAASFPTIVPTRTAPQQPSSQSHPSLDARAEIRNFPPRGKWSGSQAGSVCCSPTLRTHAQPPHGASLLCICLAPTYQPAQPSQAHPWGLRHLPGQEVPLSPSVSIPQETWVMAIKMKITMTADTVPGTSHLPIRTVQNSATRSISYTRVQKR